MHEAEKQVLKEAKAAKRKAKKEAKAAAEAAARKAAKATRATTKLAKKKKQRAQAKWDMAMFRTMIDASKFPRLKFFWNFTWHVSNIKQRKLLEARARRRGGEAS